MKKIILTLLMLFKLQNINSAQAQHISNALPKVDIAEVAPDFTCSICMEGAETGAELCQTVCQCNTSDNPVRHIFHKTCIANALITVPGKACPICKNLQTTVLYDNNDLLQACENSDWELVETIVRYGMIPQKKWIVIACAKNNIEFARMILDNGIETNPEKNINDYFYPIHLGNLIAPANSLMHACHNNNLNLIQLLLENDADITFYIKMPLGNDKEYIINSLFLACAKNHLELAQFLIKNGAIKLGDDDSALCSIVIAILSAKKNIFKILDLLVSDEAKAKFYSRITLASGNILALIIHSKFRSDEDLILEWIINPATRVICRASVNAIRGLRERLFPS